MWQRRRSFPPPPITRFAILPAEESRRGDGRPSIRKAWGMSKRKLTIRVELVSGRGERFSPRPGRILLIPPGTSFEQLGDGIDRALGRWDLAHQRQFTLLDGTLIGDPASASRRLEGLAAVPATLPLTTPVSQVVTEGIRFGYLFDPGADWHHVCAVEELVDPAEYGDVPDSVVPVWGWGTLPDQHGRQSASDDSSSRAATELDDTGLAPRGMSSGALPVDVTEIRAAGYSRDLPGLLAAVEGRSIDDALQRVGGAALAIHAEGRSEEVETLMRDVHNRASARGWRGDRELAETLRLTLQGEPSDRPVVSVDLEDLHDSLHTEFSQGRGVLLNLRTGNILSAWMRDEMDDDEEFDEEKEELAYIDDHDRRADWEDMADFVDTLPEPLATKAGDAIEGRGAFRRFRTLMEEHADGPTLARWLAYRDDRQLGRMRELMADHGFRAI